MFVVPIALTAVALVWVAVRRWPPSRRFVWLTLAVAVTCGTFSLQRMDGLSGEQHLNLSWRWSPTQEQRYLAQLARNPNTSLRLPATTQNAAPLLARADDWPGFRGPGATAWFAGHRSPATGPPTRRS